MMIIWDVNLANEPHDYLQSESQNDLQNDLRNSLYSDLYNELQDDFDIILDVFVILLTSFISFHWVTRQILKMFTGFIMCSIFYIRVSLNAHLFICHVQIKPS